MTKRLITLTTYGFFLLISFQCTSQGDTQKANNGTITGEGEIVTREITVDAMHGVKLDISGDVVLTQGSTQKVVLEGQKNVIDNITRVVKNGIWNIDFDKDVRNAKSITVHITLPMLDQVAVSGSGSIRSATKFSGVTDMKIHIAGSGNVTLEYEASTTDVDLSGSGKVNLSGINNTLSVSIAGSGDVTADNLKVDNCDVHISGSGDALVNVDKNLETSISGSGNVHYLGNAHVNSKISGSGEVSEVKR
ncbi:MAG TPA: head GIN domain-containing protein [Saprospiraceae bacterium]|nr:head GIN domain-containing protein [Saprospiraceae bacterium]